MKRISTAFVLTIFLAADGWAKTNPRTCGSGPEKRDELRLLAEQNRQARRALRRAPERAASRTVGELVVMEAAGGILSERNLFNLDETQVTFTSVTGGYRFATGAAAWITPDPAGRTLRELGDDDTAGAPLPFAFPYFGARHTSVWINSDGNLTFDRPDTASSDRSLGRFNAGPPRIAPLFMDLDPSRAGTVVVTSNAQRFTVTWLAVPEYRSVGVGSPNTFQVTLYPSGRIEFAYRGVTSAEAVTGIARGRLEGSSSIVAFLAGSAATFASSIVERFSLGGDIDMVTLSQRFYEQFDDAYDYLAVYNAMGISAGDGVVAYEVTVRNQRTGYGDIELDDGAQYGSPRRLQAVLNMGPLTQYPADPNGLVPARASARDTPLSILGHEAGHLFLAFASVRDPQNAAARPMLGVQSAHWAFNFNSEASLLEGNRIRDLGAGVSPRFETIGSSEGYSPLDQYLMGLRAPAEVPPTFVVTDTTLGFLLRPPQTSVRFDGRRRDVLVEELIAAEGRRVPDHTVAQRRFRFAFVLLTRPGVEPTADQLAQAERYRAEFPAYYARVTDGRATAETTVRRALAFATQSAAGVRLGQSAALRLDVAEPSPAALNIRLTAQPAGIVSLPATVTLAAGATSTLVPLQGLTAGVTELVAEADERFASALTKVQVADAAALGVFIAEPDRQQVLRPGRDPDTLVVRAADANRVPYPGVSVAATATGGAVEPATAVTDAAGEARFRYVPGPGPAYEALFRLAAEPPARVLLAGAPLVADGGVRNAASYSPGLSPGGLAAMFGASLSAVERAASAPFPGALSLAGTQVLLNGSAVQLLYVSDRQINFVVPGVAPGVHEIEVRTAAGTSEKKPVSVEEAWPGLFAAARTPTGLRLVATGIGGNPELLRALVGDTRIPVSAIRRLPAGDYEILVTLTAGAIGTVPVRLAAGDRVSNAIDVTF